ncbi:aspartate dehydrogenase [Caballeronia sp. dw_19]|uniref:aspartate dehydrogenase n=1 Tax=Caballeronia sp. dw_19 TaxID=2719791 RepID=UPI001BD4712B|nr:aspartate dehydrogenase [Caballeronia sp. dw_19]
MDIQPSAGALGGDSRARVTLIGFGAIGSTVFDTLAGGSAIVIDQIVTSPRSVEAVRRRVGASVAVASTVDGLPRRPQFALECAGHRAISDHVIPLLRRGVDCAIASVGALADDALREALNDATASGGVRVALLSGAVGGLDALSAAAVGGLDEVRYTGRKPTDGWRDTPADAAGVLDGIRAATVIFDGPAGTAARLYPKNANVAAAVALAGVGFERTRVQLIADPTATTNTHTIWARGVFGELRVEIDGNPLAQNRKTSALTAFSAVHFLRDRCVAQTFP